MGALAGYVLVLILVLGGGYLGAASFLRPAAETRPAAADHSSDQQAGRKAAGIHGAASPRRPEHHADVPHGPGSKSRASIGGLRLKASDAEVWRSRRQKRSRRR